MALVAHSRVDDLLDAVDVRRERRDDDATARIVESAVKCRTDRTLRRRMALALRIRRIRHEHEDAAVAEVGEAAEVRHLAVNRRVVELEVARVHDHADRRLDGEADGVRDRVIDADEADTEAADIDDVALHDRVQVARVNAVLLEAALEDAERQARAVDRHIDFLEDVRQCADVILVAVRQHDGLDLILVLDEVADVRDDEVDAEHVLIREHQARINDENLVIHADDCHILADLPQASERDDL